MTEKLIEAAQQALTAMEDLKTYDIRPSNIWRYFYPSATGDYVNLREFQQKAEPAINAFRAALAEQTVPSDCADSHQPVAWMVYTADGKSVCVTDHPADFVQWRSLPLYTTPPQRPPLTDGEIDALALEVRCDPAALRSAIERKVRGEKE